MQPCGQSSSLRWSSGSSCAPDLALGLGDAVRPLLAAVAAPSTPGFPMMLGHPSPQLETSLGPLLLNCDTCQGGCAAENAALVRWPLPRLPSHLQAAQFTPVLCSWVYWIAADARTQVGPLHAQLTCWVRSARVQGCTLDFVSGHMSRGLRFSIPSVWASQWVVLPHPLLVLFSQEEVTHGTSGPHLRVPVGEHVRALPAWVFWWVVPSLRLSHGLWSHLTQAHNSQRFLLK